MIVAEEKSRITPDHAIATILLLLEQLRQSNMALEEKTTLIGVLRTENAGLASKITALQAQLTAKETAYQQLADEFAAFKASKFKDSHNSSKPPSTDGLQKKTKSLRKPSGKPPGGQSGHKGCTLTWSEKPTRTIKLTLPDHCDHCGEALAAATTRVTEKRQVIDLPPILPEVTEYHTLEATCPHCGRMHASQFPTGVTERIQYGPRIQASAVLLTHWHNQPYLRAQQTLASLFNVRVSQGTLFAWAAKAAARVQSEIGIIKNGVVNSPVASADESGLRVDKKLHWLHIAATAHYTWYGVHPKRGMEAIKAHDIWPRFKGVLVHDCFRPYWQLTHCEHALCNAHLLRELVYTGETTKQAWPEQLSTFLVSCNKLRNAAKVQGWPITDQSYWLLSQNYGRILTEGERLNPQNTQRSKKRGRIKQTVATNLLARLRDHTTEVLRFLHNPDVPFTNNDGERPVRMVKGKQKISGCFRSMAGAEIYCNIRSYLDTLRKQGRDGFEALLSVFQGNPIQPTCG